MRTMPIAKIGEENFSEWFVSWYLLLCARKTLYFRPKMGRFGWVSRGSRGLRSKLRVPMMKTVIFADSFFNSFVSVFAEDQYDNFHGTGTVNFRPETSYTMGLVSRYIQLPLNQVFRPKFCLDDY